MALHLSERHFSKGDSEPHIELCRASNPFPVGEGPSETALGSQSADLHTQGPARIRPGLPPPRPPLQTGRGSCLPQISSGLTPSPTRLTPARGSYSPLASGLRPTIYRAAWKGGQRSGRQATPQGRKEACTHLWVFGGDSPRKVHSPTPDTGKTKVLPSQGLSSKPQTIRATSSQRPALSGSPSVLSMSSSFSKSP